MSNTEAMCSAGTSGRMSIRTTTLAGAVMLCAITAFSQTPMGQGGTTGQNSNSPDQSGSPTSNNSNTNNSTSSNGNTNSNGNMSAGDKGMAGMDKNGGANGDMAMDKMFVRKALQGGMAEVELGQLALTKSSNADVKNFAQKMIDDHTKLNNDMMAVAQQLGVPEPKHPSKKDMETKTKLSALNGDAFDKAYIKDMVKDHEMDEKDFKSESQTASIPAVKDAATKGEPVISMHLDMIKQLAQTNNVASK